MRSFALLAACLSLFSTTLAADSNLTTPLSSHQILPSTFRPPQVFKNINLLRNINLEKGYVRETVNVVIENIDAKPQEEYYIPIKAEVLSKLGGLEVRDKKDPDKAAFHSEVVDYDPYSQTQFYRVTLPSPLAFSSQQTLSISYHVLASLKPLPTTINQQDKQYLLYTFSTTCPSVYLTQKQKTKVKFPSSDVPNFTSDPERQGSTFTYGPYDDIPAGAEQEASVRYEFTKPVIHVTLLERDIEISQWGGNLATEERYWLTNIGASLANHFSRVAWASSQYYNPPTSALKSLNVPLKVGSLNPYFTDDIGNVSTSRFRSSLREANLELKPRYPVFGGWKYSFRIGWDANLKGFLRSLKAGNGYVLKVPFLEGPKMGEGVSYERVELRVILPEGAKNVKFETAVPLVAAAVTSHQTFMDTLGRTSLKLTAINVIDESRDEELIVTYDYPFSAAFRKPITIFIGVISVFVAAWGISKLDVIAHELSSSLCSLRLSNVYDLSSRIFLLKFAKPNHKEQIVIDSGFRCHLTSFARETAAVPSVFVARLRKFLKTRRVTSVSQVGTDRIIEFQFSDGQYRLFLEFYAGGNIVLTDKELGILALFRIVSEGADQEELRVGLKYSLDNRQNYNGTPLLTKERVRDGLQTANDRAQGDSTVPTKKSKKKSGGALRKAMATSLNEFPPILIDHALQIKGLDPNTSVEEVLKDDSTLERLMEALGEAQKVISDITNSSISKGYIIAKPIKSKSVGADDHTLPQVLDEIDGPKSVIYDDFNPFRPRQFEGNADLQILEFKGFNKTVDEFFSSIEAQKLESRLTEREENAKRKLETARKDHEKRLGGLQQVQELNVRRAQAIEVNLQRVQEAIAAVNGLIAQGMDWVEVARLIEMEQARQNPVAEMVKLPLKLYENTVTLLLAEAEYNGEEEDYDGDETGSDVSNSENERVQSTPVKAAKPADKRLAVDVDLSLSPWSNARQYYDQKKTAAVKEQKTLQSSSKALKNTEKKINADLKKGLKQEKQVLRPVRQQLWFEKFLFFISSDGYLVLGGKDSQQNEILYKRHLKRGDAYIHADLQGAAAVFIKNKPGLSDSPIPPSTLSQAGTLAVATSIAWDSKAVMSAWWVNSEQVSKTTPTGEYLTTGNFAIRGKKNFLPPAHLLLGFGVMFQISEESKARHLKHRLQDETNPKNSDVKEFAVGDPTEKAEEEENRTDDGLHQTDEDQASDEDQQESDAQETESESQSDMDSDHDHDHEPDSEHANPLQTNGPHSSNAPPTKPTEPATESINNDASSESESTSSSVSEPSQQPITEGNPSPTTTNGPTPNVRHISAKERRLLRKGLTSTNNPPPSNQASATPTPPIPLQSSNTLSTTTPGSQPPRPRGKHGKTAKLKTKYANQDDTDRALALRLLGSAAFQQKAVDDAAAKEAKEAAAAAQKQRRREQHERAVEKGREEEEARRLRMEDGGAGEEGEDEAEDLEVVERFVGMPLPGDEVLEAVAVCGPWEAVGGRCRWRAKLQPGALKKGKAVREILGRWGVLVLEGEKRRGGDGGMGEAEEVLRRREGELVRGLREQEVGGVVPVGRCRVVMGGGEGGKGKGGGGGAVGKGKRGGRGSKKR